MSWQPIGSAPKDGNYAFAALVWDDGRVVIGWWVEGLRATEIEPPIEPHWEDVGGFILHPTHWMPLPSPPEGV